MGSAPGRETAIHRVDAEAAAATSTAFPATFAADGIDELLTCFVVRPSSRLRADVPCSLLVQCSDTDAEWTLYLGAEVPSVMRARTDATCRVHAKADTRRIGLSGTGRPTMSR